MNTDSQEIAAKQEPDPTPPEWLTAEPPLVLEEFYLTRLNLGFTPPASPDVDTATQVRSSFNYEIAIHNEDPLRYQLIFQVKTQELTDTDIAIGRSVDVQIFGNFVFPNKDISLEQKNFQIRVGGVSVLYGLLRGIISSATAQFPGGHFILPTYMPQRIVALVEGDHRRRAALAAQNKDKNESPTASPSEP